MRGNITLIAGAAAAVALAGAASDGWGRGLSHREREELERERLRKRAPAPVSPPANLPGETNRQFAARMKALRASAETNTTHPEQHTPEGREERS